MRRRGKIAEWNDDRGFGFITPDSGGERVFVHVKAFSNRHRRPRGNETVTYELVSAENGRRRAEDVAFIADNPGISAQIGVADLALPGLFLLLVATFVFVGKLPFVVLGLYLGVSVAAFAAYAKDKAAAERGQWRTSENTLQMLSLIGGWPGAFLAQRRLHHKSRKPSFQGVFWAFVSLNCLGLGWLLTQPGAAALRSVFGPD